MAVNPPKDAEKPESIVNQSSMVAPPEDSVGSVVTLVE